ncbi:MAG: aldehyde dehydrogenase family protein [Phycisphaerales bacterium JB040]
MPSETTPHQPPTPSDLRWLRRFRRSIAQRTPDLVSLIESELGKAPFESLTSDLVPLLASCRWHEKHARRVLRPRRARGRSIWQLGQRHTIHHAPLGHVAIIATWNYPVQLLGIQLVQALVAGNRVTVKPSERSPRTHAVLLDLAHDAGVPESRLSRTEATRAAGESLLRDHAFDHVVFTGSTAVGRAIASRLGESLTPVTLELSGCDSAIVLADADLDLAARSIALACALNRGQTCMAPRRVIVAGSVADEFERLLRARLDRRVLPGAIDPDERRRTDDLLRGSGLADPDHATVQVARCDPSSPLARGEHFGPGAALLVADSDEHALELHRSYPQHLATSLFTRNTRRARTIAPTLPANTLTINDAVIPTAHPGVPITGRGPSGHTPSRGEPGLLAMTRPVVVSTTRARLRTPLDPPDERTQARLTAFVRWWYSR